MAAFPQRTSAPLPARARTSAPARFDRLTHYAVEEASDADPALKRLMVLALIGGSTLFWTGAALTFVLA
jgi:hypothetical protein